jgi:two-component system probable response regulator PhcQ
MQNHFDYRRFAVLYVDDEEKSLKNFARAFGDQFRILTAPNAQEGLRVLEQHRHEIGVLMTDQRMPGEKGVWLIERARQLEPRILRILVTAFADVEAAIQAVNAGAIYKYINKPWDPPFLETQLKRALEFFMVQLERDQLVKEKVDILHHLMTADRLLSLGLLAAGLSHHIRNALVAVKTFLDLAPAKLRQEGVDPDRLKQPDFWNDYYRNVQGQLEKINNLLKDLWMASERPAFDFKDVVRLREVLESVLARFQEALTAKGIHVDNQVPTTLPELSVDRKKFSRLFELLFEDELVSLPPGRQIVIAAEPGGPGTPSPEIRVEVRDNGPGLTPKDLELIFDPFMVRTDSPTEYGIRLMACFFIVHQHGGRIIARSAEGKGTTFVLKLPTHPAQMRLAEESQTFLRRVFLNEELWEKHLATG